MGRKFDGLARLSGLAPKIARAWPAVESEKFVAYPPIA